MNILVTGGAGFIGSHFCEEVSANEENNITIVDNLSLGRIENIEFLMSKKNVEFLQGDITDTDFFYPFFEKKKYDAIVHLAANSDIAKSFSSPEIDYKNTFQTTFCVLEACRRFEVKQILFASTSAIYGDTSSTLHENFGPLQPVSHYGAGKLASEAFISSYCSNYNIKTWIFRFPNVVGERATHGVIYDFYHKIINDPKKLIILGDGTQKKPYLYVKDLVQAMLFIWKNASEQLNVYNIGVTSNTTVTRIAQILLEEMEEQRDLVYTGGKRGWQGDVPFFDYNVDKLAKLGWRAPLTSDDAVRKAVQSLIKSYQAK